MEDGSSSGDVARGSPVPDDRIINEQPLVMKTLILDTVAEDGTKLI